MTIKQCEYIILISRCGSFSEAANRLFISQSNLSMIIKDLEKEFGIKIFNRSNKGVTLTPEGNEFIKYAAKIISQSEMINERFNKKIKRKYLSVFTQHYDFAADVFADFVNKNQDDGYYFIFKETQTAEVVNAVKNSTCDLGIIVIKEGDMQTERYLKNNKISYLNVAKAKPHVFVRYGHPISSMKTVDLYNMHDYPYITYGQGEYADNLFREELTEDEENRRKIEINDRATLMNLLLSTNSFTVGTGIMKSELNKGSIIAIPLESSDNYNISILTSENSVFSAEANDFSEMLKSFFG